MDKPLKNGKVTNLAHKGQIEEDDERMADNIHDSDQGKRMLHGRRLESCEKI